MSRRGFTLVEILAVIGIILVVIALAMPAISQAKESANQRHCQSNLRQLYFSLQLYRQDYGGDGIYGDAYAMGLPPAPPMHKLPELLTLRCPSAGNELFSEAGVHYYNFWLDPTIDGLVPKWRDYTNQYKDQSILFADMNHNSKSIPLVEGNFLTRLGLGVLEGGSLLRRRKRGDWLYKPWWNNSKE